jgi:hypothetical protein
VAVIALSGWLFRLGVRLRPVAAASWVAPLPLLVFAPRVSLSLAVGAAAGAWLVGQLGLWSCYRRGPKITAPLVAVQFAAGSLGIAAIVALARACLIAGQLVVAAVSVPIAWVAVEFPGGLAVRERGVAYRPGRPSSCHSDRLVHGCMGCHGAGPAAGEYSRCGHRGNRNDQ